METADPNKYLEDETRDAVIEQATRLAEAALSGATDTEAILREPKLVADFVTNLAVGLAPLHEAEMKVKPSEV